MITYSMANPIAYYKPKRRQISVYGLSYTSVAVSLLIPFVLDTIGDTWQIETDDTILFSFGHANIAHILYVQMRNP